MDNNPFFAPDADAIFHKAGLTKDDSPELHQEIIDILAMNMAFLSATMGLSYARVDAYEKQKQSLLDDLLKLKAEGALR